MQSTVSLSKGCFLFKNGHGKKSKTTKNKKKKSTDESLSLLDNNFKSEKWYETYRFIRNNIQTQIQALQAQNHKHLLDNLCEFINDGLEEYQTQLPAVALLTGVNQPDHLDFFKIISTELRKRLWRCRIVILQARDCSSMKSTIEALVSGLMNDNDDPDDDDEEDLNSKGKKLTLPRSRYTFEVLRNWFNNFYLDEEPRLLVFIPDFEMFSSKILEDFLRVLSLNFSNLPFALIMGIATEISTLHRTLPFYVTTNFNLCVSHAVPCKIGLSNILENIILTPKCPIQLSGKIFSLLTDIFLFHDMSITSFVQGFQYCIMEHYYQGNEYSICADYQKSLENLHQLSQDDLEHIRRLPSFRPFVESFTDCRDVIAIFEDDQFFIKKLETIIRDIYIYFNYFYAFLRVLVIFLRHIPSNKIGKELRDIYSICASMNLVETPEFLECWQLICFMSTGELIDRLHEVVMVLETYTNDFCMDDDIGKECAETIRKIENKLKNATEMLCTNVGDESATKVQKQKILNFIKEKLFTMYLRPFSNGPPLLELFVFSDVSTIRSHIMGTPRAALDAALRNPQYYLNCDCCTLDNPTQLISTMPDISIAFKLHLECGRMINLFDWLQAFRSILDGNDIEDGSDVNAEIQARFTRAVAELEFLGFIKSSKRKTDHVTRLTW